jgi:hypothetical protein
MKGLWRAVQEALVRPTGPVVLALAVLATFTLFRMVRVEGWDDAFYVAQLTSVVGDSDLMLQDDLLAVANEPARRLETVARTLPSGAPVNTFSIGPAVVHSFYLWPALRGTAETSGAFRVLVTIGSMALLAITVLATARWLESLGYSGWTVVFASALPLLWSPLLVYGTRSYLNAHLPAACTAALLLLAADRWCVSFGVRRAVAVGLGAGLLVALRWQDALLPAAMAPGLVLCAMESRDLRRRGSELLAAAGAALLPVAVQMLAFRAQFGRWWLMPQGGGYMQWSHPALASFVASPFHGLLPWTPGLAVGLLAFALAVRRIAPERRALYVGLVVLLPIALYVNAAVRDWWGGESFGPRRLATLVPLAALGWAVLFRALPRAASAVLAVAFTLWAVVTASAFYSGWDDLAVFLGGAPAADNPTAAARYVGLQWVNRWGPLHAAKPGFTFSDQPGNVDRLIGLAVTALVLAAVAAVWRWVTAGPARQRAVLAAGAGWALVWIVLLARVPSNAGLDARWREIVRGREADLSALPAGVQAAAQLVLAAHAAVGGREAEAERRLAAARSPEFPPFTREDLRKAVASPAVQDVLAGTRVP